MKKIIIVFILIFLLQTINFAEAKNTLMDNIMDSWNGQNISSVIGSWGQPSQVSSTENGKIYYWKQAEQKMTVTGKKDREGKVYCVKIFETDDKDNIINWQYQGASCPKIEVTGRRFLNQNENNIETSDIQE